MEGVVAAELLEVGDGYCDEDGDGELEEAEEDVEGSAFGFVYIDFHDYDVML